MAAAAETWRGFEPTGYEIDWKILSDTPLSELNDGGNRLQTTAGAVLREALPQLFTPLNEDGSLGVTPARQGCEIEEGTGRVTIKTPTRTIKLDTLGNGSSFAADLITTIIKLDQLPKQGSFHPIFFYYDRDHVVDDVHESFSFFVVNDNRVALDRVTFSRHSGSGFDPAMLKPAFAVEHEIWASESSVKEAQVRWWYRRFYDETDAGQLTTLRDDVDLYHYVPEWKQRQLIATNIQHVGRILKRLQTLAICALIALGLIVLLLWR